MAKALTVRAIESATAADERREIPDGLLRGLYFIVQPSGTKSWAIRYRHKGTPRKHTLGNYPALDLAQAREAGAKALRAVAEGRDPGVEKQQARSELPDTVGAVVAEFIAAHVQRNNRPRTAEETERLFNLHVLPHWQNRPIKSITRRDVHALLDRVIAGGSPVAANRTFSAVRKLFVWAMSRDIVDASPCAGIDRPTEEKSRDRVLTDAELKNVWRAAAKIGFPFGPLVQLLILTACRRDEIAGLRWSEIVEILPDRAALVLPAARTKNGVQHEIPLSAPAIAILKSLPRIDGSTFVLTTNGEVASSDFGKKKRKLDALLPPGTPSWTLHDIRRTTATGMAKIGIGLPVIEKCLNHVGGSFGGIAGVYQKHEFAEEKRRAFEAWGRHVEDLVSGKTKTANVVVALRKRRR
jgi:integrase